MKTIKICPSKQRSLFAYLSVILLISSAIILSLQSMIYFSHEDNFQAKGGTAPHVTPMSLSITEQRHSLVTSLTGVRTSLLEPCKKEVVPNIVHYVWFGEYETLRFHHMLSILSAHKFIRPERILIHCDFAPVGQWWKYIRSKVPNIEIVKREPPTEIFGNQVILQEHKSDIVRMQVLMEHGGIYLDTDVIALKSFNGLRKYNFTMGIEYHGEPGRLNNGVIIAEKSAEFLRLWYDTYRNFTKREWDYHDSIIPYSLQFQYPQLIHVEENTINYPSGKKLELIYETRYDWRQNYAMHLWYRLHEIDHNPRDIRAMNTTFGEIARFVYYGNSSLLTS